MQTLLNFSQGPTALVIYIYIYIYHGPKRTAKKYGGPEVTFSQSGICKVNKIVFKHLLFDFSKVERVLCSSLSCLTSVKSNEFCVQAFAFLFDFSKVERVLCSSLSCSTLVKSNEFCVCSSLSCSTLVKSNRGILSCKLRVVSCQLRVESCQPNHLILVSY